VPHIYRWKNRSKIIKRYRDVVDVDQALSNNPSSVECAALLERMDRIEEDVRSIKVPLGYADAHYHLRMHADLVRRRAQEISQRSER